MNSLSARIWAYDTVSETIRTLYDRETASDPDALLGVDNLTVSAGGDVLVAEDAGAVGHGAGHMFVVTYVDGFQTRGLPRFSAWAANADQPRASADF